MKIISVNIRGFITNFDEFALTLQTSDIEIACVCETFLSASVPDAAISIPGFSFLRKDRLTDKGGLLVFFRNHLIVSRSTELESTDFETIWFTVKNGISSILCCSAYWPPNSSVDLCSHFSSAVDTYFFAENTSLVILGDLNCHHTSWPYCTYTNPAGRLLYDFISDHNLTQIVTDPTRITATSISCIDFVLTNNTASLSFDSVLEPIGSSDHSVVSIQWHHSQLFYPPDSSIKSRRTYHPNISSLNDRFINTDWDLLLSAENIDHDWSTFKNQYFTSMNACSKTTVAKTCTYTSRLTDEQSAQLTIYKRDKSNAWNRYIANRNADTYHEFSNARKNVKYFARQLKRSDYAKNLQQLSEAPLSSKTWHRLAKSLYIGYRAENQLPPLSDSDGRLISDPQGKANLLNRDFTSRGQKTRSEFPTIPRRTNQMLCDVNISALKVAKMLSSLDPNKSTGPDGIEPRILKQCADSLCVPLSILFNKSLNQGILPKDWKLGHVTPIFKNKGSKASPKNYRPITITSAVGKAFEHIINEALVNYLLRNDLISDRQFGFLPKHSTTDQLAYLLHEKMSLVAKKRHTASVFLDLAAAFDSVPHAAIKQKLPAYGIRGKLFRWLSNYLDDRTQCVKLEGILSDPLPVLSGVPQGGVVAPILFLLFINDLSDTILESVHNTVSGASGTHLVYADDTMLSASAESVATLVAYLNTQLSAVHNWALRWGMKFNPDKTVAIYFSKSTGSNLLLSRLRFMNQSVALVSEHKHLGFIIRSDLSFCSHIDSICKSVASRIFLLRRLSMYIYDPSVLLRLYKSYILPLFEYASPAWSALAELQCGRLERLQRRAIRIILNYRYADPVTITDYAQLHLHPLKVRRNFALACYGYKLLNNYTPRCLQSVAPILQTFPARTRRGTLIVPAVDYPTQRFLDKSPILFSTKILNCIPELWECPSLDLFKSQLWSLTDRSVFNMSF